MSENQSTLFTAHCGFPVDLKVPTKAAAVECFEKLDFLVKTLDKPFWWTGVSPSQRPCADDQDNVANWRGIDVLPPVSENGEWSFYTYIKVFLEAKHGAAARAQLDRLYASAGPGENADRDVVDRLRPCGTWDFSIKPSVGEELEPKNRTSPTGAAAKDWQKARPVPTEDQISPNDPLWKLREKPCANLIAPCETPSSCAGFSKRTASIYPLRKRGR